MYLYIVHKQYYNKLSCKTYIDIIDIDKPTYFIYIFISPIIYKSM